MGVAVVGVNSEFSTPVFAASERRPDSVDEALDALALLTEFIDWRLDQSDEIAADQLESYSDTPLSEHITDM
jgi:hypothetical protein